MIRDGDLIAGLEREFALLVRRDHAASGRLGRDAHPGLNAGAYGLLAHLAEHGPCRPTALAGHIGITAPTVSRQLQQLEELGLTARLPAPDDRRAYLVALTGPGRRRVAEVQAVRTRWLGDRLDSWLEHDVRALTELLAKFNGNAGEGTPGAKHAC
ncbi:MarR family winged helix-turn-helix transcriptional regulator [Amycolatopsis jiangsuensis]|uniref:DNA-binding MarR family transcriptional regulator n=1 Tax=Amycolatopsis jiangsuensis TaxID=1181879 RepID=A0A840IS67_9PSEU|nr:MarR family transcriptional regulator [Amycolatopsis jiangsuensis]MBB4683998.1 DNA-binding MarR family transcriptional regulator [Amycolatopsis jiangsuensis]